MASFASTSDVEGLWRTLTEDEKVIAGNQLTFASAIIRQAVPDIDDRIAAGTLDADLVKNVAVSMVLRVMRNPDGKLEESIDDYSYRRDSAQSTGAMYLSDSELKLLKARRSRSFSVAPYRPTVTVEDHEAVALVRAERDAWP